MKVLMLPIPKPEKPGTSGISRVVEAYTKHLPSFDIELVHPDSATYDLLALHVSDSHTLTDSRPMVLHNHGLHWTADYNCAKWQHYVNGNVINAIRHATTVTVPSAWVAESFQRDMRFTPTIIPHGIDWSDWQSNEPVSDYILWNKNRAHDVCDPTPLLQLARAYPKEHFVTTFVPEGLPSPTNTNVIGLIPHDQMKRLVQSSLVYLSTTKETFGLGALEAMASGVPVLGYAHGGNVELIQHGVNGYLAQPGDAEDLIEGLAYCLNHRNTLGANGRELAREWTWDSACEKVAEVYREALNPAPARVGIVIPVYNKSEQQIRRALNSAIQQTCHSISRIVVIDDGSDDPSIARSVVEDVRGANCPVVLLEQGNSGVANARNRGIEKCDDAKYVCCLDSDDAIEDRFIEVCVEALEADRSLGIAYTSLYYFTPDGREGISEWPGAWDYDAHLKRQNQVPTCCVYRKEMWERLGGYRQRYAPSGAGEEDAEFFLRAGAYGYRAEKVTEEPLFVYSWQSGIVSGNKTHAVTDWTGWHPWVSDRQHPFASYATPRNKLSHPVRQYDEPAISIIIPVGPNHWPMVINALDSLEAQSFRKWEVILVDDAITDDDTLAPVLRAYPYARFRQTNGQEGPGRARNIGAGVARAQFLLFLDADDWLYPDCLERMVAAWNEHERIIYTDYVGKAIVSPEDLADDLQDRLYTYNEKTGEAVIGYRAFDYDCELAQSQPQGERPYIWTNVTSLIPRTWHNSINGFDESLTSWEDVDYHWRLAKAGYCYHRIEQELLVYNFHYGHRREQGRQTYQNLLDYLRDKHEGIEIMACSGCGGRRARQRRTTTVQGTQPTASQAAAMDDSNFVMVKYLGKGGKHQVTGLAMFDAPIPGWRMLRKSPELWSIRYGGRSRNDRFLVHRDDVAAQPGVFVPVETQQILSAPVEERIVEAPRPLTEEVAEVVEVVEQASDSVIGDSAPVSNSQTATGIVDSILAPQPTSSAIPPPSMGERHATFDLQTLPGVGGAIAKQLEADDIDSREKILALGVEGLQRYKGVSEPRAQAIIKALEE